MLCNIKPPGTTRGNLNPTASRESSYEERRLFCNHYSSCLNIAIEKGWSGFTCRRCEAFAKANWSAEDRTEDEFKCMALILTIFCKKRYAYLNPGRIVERLEQDTRWGQEYGGVLAF